GGGTGLWQFLARGVAALAMPDTNPEVATEEEAEAAEAAAAAAVAAAELAGLEPVVVSGEEVDDTDALSSASSLLRIGAEEEEEQVEPSGQGYEGSGEGVPASAGFDGGYAEYYGEDGEQREEEEDEGMMVDVMSAIIEGDDESARSSLAPSSSVFSSSLPGDIDTIDTDHGNGDSGRQSTRPELSGAQTDQSEEEEGEGGSSSCSGSEGTARCVDGEGDGGDESDEEVWMWSPDDVEMRSEFSSVRNSENDVIDSDNSSSANSSTTSISSTTSTRDNGQEGPLRLAEHQEEEDADCPPRSGDGGVKEADTAAEAAAVAGMTAGCDSVAAAAAAAAAAPVNALTCSDSACEVLPRDSTGKEDGQEETAVAAHDSAAVVEASNAEEASAVDIDGDGEGGLSFLHAPTAVAHSLPPPSPSPPMTPSGDAQIDRSAYGEEANSNDLKTLSTAPHDEPCSSTAASSDYESSSGLPSGSRSRSCSGEEEEEDFGEDEDVFSKFDGEEIPMAVAQTAAERAAADTMNNGPDAVAPRAPAGQESKAGEGAGTGGVWADFGCTDGYADGYGDSDAESEYTPEEAIEVLRRAAIRYSTAGAGRRESVGAGRRESAGGASLGCPSPAVSRVAGGISRASSSRSSGPWRDDAAQERDSESVARESLLSLEGDGAAGAGEEEEGENSESVIKMEKSFKKACTVLGIDMNKFFDTILESSLGNDVDEYSHIDATAAVAAATAGVEAPHDSVVVSARPLCAVLGKPGSTAELAAQLDQPPSTPRGAPSSPAAAVATGGDDGDSAENTASVAFTTPARVARGSRFSGGGGGGRKQRSTRAASSSSVTETDEEGEGGRPAGRSGLGIDSGCFGRSGNKSSKNHIGNGGARGAAGTKLGRKGSGIIKNIVDAVTPGRERRRARRSEDATAAAAASAAVAVGSPVSTGVAGAVAAAAVAAATAAAATAAAAADAGAVP
ncbi:unnamed protein product, partial [Hapterophycus canaliculatus]